MLSSAFRLPDHRGHLPWQSRVCRLLYLQVLLQAHSGSCRQHSLHQLLPVSIYIPIRICLHFHLQEEQLKEYIFLLIWAASGRKSFADTFLIQALIRRKSPILTALLIRSSAMPA